MTDPTHERITETLVDQHIATATSTVAHEETELWHSGSFRKDQTLLELQNKSEQEKGRIKMYEYFSVEAFC